MDIYTDRVAKEKKDTVLNMPANTGTQIQGQQTTAGTQFTHGQGLYPTLPSTHDLPGLEELNGLNQHAQIPQAPKAPPTKPSTYEQDKHHHDIPTTHTESSYVVYETHPREVVREVVVVERPMLYSYDPYPHLSMPTAWIILIINIFMPGIGTMIVACLGTNNSLYFLVSGLFQLITAYFLIGWILAIWTSVELIMSAK